MQKVKDVTAAILFNDNKVLIAQRANNDPLAGFWEFPGGKVEEGESPEESLIREMQEEFCIDIKVEKYFTDSIYPYGRGTIRLLAYISKYTGGHLHSTVHNDYKWVAVQELNQFTFAPADRPIVEKLMRAFISS